MDRQRGKAEQPSPHQDPFHQLGPSERKLFLSLWVVLILAFALWHFYPTFEPRETASAIPVEIATELNGRLEQADVWKSSPSQHWLHLQFASRFLHTLPEDGHSMLLGYDLQNDARVIYSGVIRFDLGRHDDSAQLVLPNPERVYTRRIRLYLPH